MKRATPIFLLLAFSTPALAQTVDGPGAKQLSDNLAHYFGKRPFDIGLVKISVHGDSYELAFDFKPIANLLAKQQPFKFDLTPYSMFAKPREDGRWDLSADTSFKGSFDFTGSEGPQRIDFTVSNNKFSGVYDPAIAAFVNATGSMDAMTMKTREAKQQVDASAGAGIAMVTATKSANGGIDFTLAEKVLSIAEAIKVDDAETGSSLSTSFAAPEFSVDATGKGLKTKSLLDLLAFGVANESEVEFKANQAELKTLLLAALPVFDRIDGAYGFRDFTVDSPVGKFGATQLKVTCGMDGISPHGGIDYGIKATGLTLPHQMIPEWSVALLPTDIDLNFGGANIDLDSMARKAIEAFDLNRNPPLSDAFGETLKADFMASNPKVVLGRSTIKNKGIEIALEGEMTFAGLKPDATMTVDVAGYDKIVAALQTAAKTEQEAAQFFPFALAAKGFAKTLPDGRIEWVINAKPDGSVLVNGAMLKPADPIGGESDGQNDSGDLDDNGGAGADLNP
jgi:hypothetical protein